MSGRLHHLPLRTARRAGCTGRTLELIAFIENGIRLAFFACRILELTAGILANENEDSNVFMRERYACNFCNASSRYNTSELHLKKMQICWFLYLLISIILNSTVARKIATSPDLSKSAVNLYRFAEGRANCAFETTHFNATLSFSRAFSIAQPRQKMQIHCRFRL